MGFSGPWPSQDPSNLESFADRLPLDPPALSPLSLHRDPEQPAHVFPDDHGSSADRIPPPYGIDKLPSGLEEASTQAEQRAKSAS